MIQERIQIDSSIFRAYDIRGIVDITLTEETVFLIGQAIGSLVQEHGEKEVAIARDGRFSGPKLCKALSDGLLASGCDVIDLGMGPTPLLYFATHVLSQRSGVMLTGSHNPPEYNGLKMVVNGKTLTESYIMDLYKRIVEERLHHGKGEYRQVDLNEQYVKQICDDVKLSRPLKIVIDAGNGIAGNLAPELYRALGCEVETLFCEVDGRFPNHHPDPSQPENLQDLIERVKATNADVGLAFDGDADRLGVVTNRGEIIWSDRVLMLYAKALLKAKPNATIIYDVKCTHHLANIVRQAGGVPLMWKTGHSLIKSKMQEIDAKLAGEMSGHFFFKDRWYGFDDALYAGARLLEILSNETDDCSTLFKAIPDSVNTPELKVSVREEDKFSVMQRLVDGANFSGAELVTIDGLRVNFAEGWGLLRPSNTTPCLVLRFEAESAAMLEVIQEKFRSWMMGIEPSFVLPF